MNWLWRKIIGMLFGRTVDSITGGDPLDPANSFYEEEEREPDPIYPNEVFEGTLGREKFREVIAALDSQLDKGFRDTQKDVLAVRAQRLKPGDRFVLLCSVYHGGFPTGLQITAMRVDAGNLLLHLEGRGPAMEVTRNVLEEFGVSAKEERDGVFHEDQLIGGWRAKLPAEWGTFLGHPIDMQVEKGWPGMAGIETPAESLFLQGIVKSLKQTLGAADGAFRRFVGEDVVGDVSEPWIYFSADAPSHAEWMLIVSRSNWQGFRWRIDFVGTEAVDISAGE